MRNLKLLIKLSSKSEIFFYFGCLLFLYACGTAVPEKPNPPKTSESLRAQTAQGNAFSKLSSAEKSKQLKRFIQIQNTEKLFIYASQRPAMESIPDTNLRDAYWDLSRNCDISIEKIDERLNGLSTTQALTVSRAGASFDGSSCPAEYSQKIKPFVNILLSNSGKVVDKAKILIDYRLNSQDIGYDKFLAKMRLDGEAEKRTEVTGENSYKVIVREKYDGLIHSRNYGLAPVVKRMQSTFEWSGGKLVRNTLIQIWTLQIGNESLEFRTEKEIGANKDEVGFNRFYIDGKEINMDEQLQLIAAGNKK